MVYTWKVIICQNNESTTLDRSIEKADTLCVIFIIHDIPEVKVKGKGSRFIVLYPPWRSHDLPLLAGLYTRKPFQSPGGYSRATGSI